MKYLVDSLQSYESGHSDALCPVQREADKSFMGDHKLFEPVTVNEFRTISSSITHTIKETINAAITSMVMLGRSDPPAGRPSSRLPTTNDQATAIGDRSTCRNQQLVPAMLPTSHHQARHPGGGTPLPVERLSNILHNISNHSTYISVY